MTTKPKRPRRNLNAQEEVVAALYEFSEKNKPTKEDGYYLRGNNEKCYISRAAVETALTRIMKAFNCEITQII
jgi:hypothetical protein